MNVVTAKDLKALYRPPKDSHKGQNGRLLIIGGSYLFHAASLWALEVASKIVDLVHYSSTPENNELVRDIKKDFHDGIVIPRSDIDAYIEEDDVILIGPGMTRDTDTESLTNRLLSKYPHKQWVIDAGALQMMDINLIPEKAILTPHHKEFEDLFFKSQITNHNDQTNLKDQTSSNDQMNSNEERVKMFANKYHCIVLLKGVKDFCSNAVGDCRIIEGGNEGMTKGGTGDVLAGLIAALACKNNPFLATLAGSFINKAAGDELYEKAGPYFNASDLAGQIPLTMKNLLF